MRSFFFFLLIFSSATLLFAQEEEQETTDLFSINSPITFDLGEDEEEEIYEPKKKKRKKKIFYGIKTKKRFTRKGVGDKTTFELFYVLKEFEKPETQVRDVYWYDHRRQEVRKGGKIDPKFADILHGPYQKMRNGQILEDGIFYIGTKHGRWMHYDKNDLLVDKENYFKGRYN